ncbi:MAG: DUF4258 domain-containing protein [Bradymonadaceae bacterium]
MSRPKLENVLEVVRQHLADDFYGLSGHARSRMIERDIDLPDVIYTLRHGWHEKSKDQFDETYDSWNYAVRGKTVDDRNLRIVVTFDEGMLIVTTIDLDK